MNKLLNQLIQLQDLNFTLAEQQALLADTFLIELEDSIKALSKNLPRPILQLFATLHARYSTAVVPVTGGSCSGCGVALPTSLAYEVHVTKEITAMPPLHPHYLCQGRLSAPAETDRQAQREADRRYCPVFIKPAHDSQSRSKKP